MKNKPLVSVVMTIFNAEFSLRRAIESIQRQSLKDFEFLIINDGSTDKSFSIVNEYMKNDKRIRVITNERNLQIAHSLNIGVFSARADFIARMDSDDISFPKRLEVQYTFLQKHPKVAIVGANILIIDENESIISKREYPTRSDDLKKVMFRYSPFAHPTVMFRKKIFQEFGGYNPQMIPCEDIDFWFKIGSKYEFGSIAEPLLKYTLSSNSNSHYNLRSTELLGFKIRLNAVRLYGFKPNLYDIIYNLLQFISSWLMPANIRIRLYNIIRSRGLI